MPPTSSFERGRDFRAFVQNALAEQDRARAAQRARRLQWLERLDPDLPAVRAKIAAKRPSFAWRARLNDEIAQVSGLVVSFGARLRPSLALAAAAPSAARRYLPDFQRFTARKAPSRAEIVSEAAQPVLERTEQELRARRVLAREQAAQARRREMEAAQARLDAAARDDWAEELAEEYRREFHPATSPTLPPARLSAPRHDETPGAVDRAAAAIFLAAKTLWHAGEAARPAWRFLLAHSAPILKLAAIALALIAAAGLLAQWPRRGAAELDPAPESPAPARRASWVEIAKPFEFYDLSAPLVANEKMSYAARRHTPGGGREDFLTFGDFSAKGPYVRLSIYRHGAEKIAAPSFFVDMARRAAPAGISLGKTEVSEMQATRFGGFETAAMVLQKGRQTRENCRGFRFSVAPPGLTMAGFACGAGDEPLSGDNFACLINRLDLVSAGDDKALRNFFAAAQARVGVGCAEPAPAKRRGR